MIDKELFEHLSEIRGGQPPIYEIYLMREAAKEYILPSGKPTGWPDTSGDSVGFYYELESAVNALHENVLDIRDGGVFNAAFILCKFPGLYSSAGRDMRLYFLWDEAKDGFWEAEEPEIFKYVGI